jgi:hypothetical protein
MEKRAVGFGLLLLLDFAITLVMLSTDQNLQTDFGSQPAYYQHWYGALAMGIVDLLAGVAVLVVAARSPLRDHPFGARRGVLFGAVAWTVLAILAMIGIVETYQQVGFESAMKFAQYLFGVTAFPGALPYIPWLYDLLFVTYILTALMGALAIRAVRLGAPRRPAQVGA